MATASQNTKKRKANIDSEFSAHNTSLVSNFDLGTLADEEGVPNNSDSEEVEPFPLLNTQSDTDEDGGQSRSYESDADETDDDDGDDEEDDLSSIEDSHIYPKPKVVNSEITGKPKKVYPEIVPDYDSDSSTEDVRFI